MRLYLAVARGSFRRYATYRVATFARVFTNSVFGLIIAYTYLALWHVRPHLGGYTLSEALTYAWIGQSLLAAVSIYGSGSLEDLEARIHSGDVAVDLYRPADLQAWWLGSDLGRFGYQALANGVLPLLVGGLLFPLRLPQGTPAQTALGWAAFALSVLLAAIVSFALRYLVALTGFWIVDVRGVQMVYTLCCAFFSGFFLPVALFPPALQTLAHALPWIAVFQVPADVLLQRYDAAGLAAALGTQLGWAVLVLALGRLVQARATRKVVLQGG
ncbi:ABC transporter permease [Streptacidiphilus monticola]|uniref:ABC transporter permease n=1 Tax=Streptacidiphilus monticola TaxID=2161674 RepID=A0ABW1FVT9_9ACTN